jgi:plasmid replication initiation protein
MSNEAQAMWDASMPDAIALFGAHVADNWLNQITPVEVANDIFTFHADKNLTRDWINERYRDDIVRVLRRQHPSLKDIQIVVVKTAEKPKGKTLRPAPADEGQLDLFAPVITDVAPRDARDAMELPFLSLSKQKRVKPIIYGPIDAPTIRIVAPQEIGIANIYDWDLIIFCVSLIRSAIDRGEPISARVRFAPGDYLRATRKPNTKGYQDGITQSLERLKATMIFTTIRTDHQARSYKKRADGFNWINHFTVITRVNQTAAGPKEIVSHYEVELCEWLVQAAQTETLVLTFDPDYFLLDGGYERWLYRLVRKSAGYKEWTWKLKQLYERSGKGESYKKFAFRMRDIVERSAQERIMPDYTLELVALESGRKKEMAIRATYTPALPGKPKKARST